MALFQKNLRYVAEVADINAPSDPQWATANRIALDLDTMRLRDFSAAGKKPGQTPALIDAPYAGHSSTIADPAVGKSLVAPLEKNGLDHNLVTDWKSATHAINIGSELSGMVLKVNLDVNDRIRKGQVLVELDPAMLRDQILR